VWEKKSWLQAVCSVGWLYILACVCVVSITYVLSRNNSNEKKCNNSLKTLSQWSKVHPSIQCNWMGPKRDWRSKHVLWTIFFLSLCILPFINPFMLCLASIY
jgi:hypothetical protein